MGTAHRLRGAVVPLLLLALPACFSLGPGSPQPIRYFSAAVSPQAVSAQPRNMPVLRLRHVTAAAHLRERMVWRNSQVEYGFYETRRWTEMPVAWLEQALARELFEVRGLHRTSAVATVTLDVHLAAFEEILYPEHLARVAVVVRLFSPQGQTLIERTLERSQPITDGGPEQVAEATSRALGELMRDVAAAIVEPAAAVR